MHAPETECIAKGKAHKKYEFGCKDSVVSTAKKNRVIGIGALHGNQYDGHTLKGAIDQAQRMTGWKSADASVDGGYRGATKDVQDVNVHRSWRRNPAITRWLKRRAAIEPIISHLKSDNGMDRNYHLRRPETTFSGTTK